MRLKFITLLFIAASAFIFSGCQSNHARMGPQGSNLLGIVKVEKAAYTATSPTTFAIASDELYDRRDVSGDKVTLLWGLITLKDY
ncbi:MAG: hypothetical protein ACI81V_001215 [Lentimonas sp.]|jgi:hypothetical protein